MPDADSWHPKHAQDLVPYWLQQSWDTANAAGLDGLSMEEIDAEIAAARVARRIGK